MDASVPTRYAGLRGQALDETAYPHGTSARTQRLGLLFEFEPISSSFGWLEGNGMTEGAASGQFTPRPPRQPSAKDRKRSIIALVIAFVIMFVVFVIVLPQVIDYEVVIDTLKALTPTEVGILLVAGFIYYVPEGWLYALVIPGMRLWQGMKAWVASTGVGSTVPAIDLATRFGMYRSWGFSIHASMRGIFLSGAFDWVVKFSLPVIAVALLFALGAQDLGALAVIAAIAGVLLVIVLIVLIGAVRSDRFTHWLAGILENVATWALIRFNREPIPDLAGQIVAFRDDAVGIARRNGLWAFLASALGKFWQYVMLVLAMRAVGIPDDVLSLFEIFVVWAIVLLITMIPITPGGIGIAELFYIYFFSLIAGPEWSSIAAAGVMLYRVFQWALPIPVGWTVVYFWRRKIKLGRLPDPFATSTPQ